MFTIFIVKDKKLFLALEEDGIEMTIQDIQKARNNDPEALYKIGDAYYKEEEYIKAFAWFHKAALQNHAEAQAQVGYMYQEGQGVPRDRKQAMKWSMKAASTGNSLGQYNIGLLYFRGYREPPDYKQAMDWWLKTANNGSMKAMHGIGFMYHHGYGVATNIPTAIEWYTKAANQGHTNAQYILGHACHYRHEYKDLQKAVNWYQKAADNNHYNAKEKVKELNKQGYYAKDEPEDILPEEKTKVEIIQGNVDTTNVITNDQTQSPGSTGLNNKQVNASIDSKLNDRGKLFESKLDGMKNKHQENQARNHGLQNENQLLLERLAELEAVLEGDANNDLNYDSSDDEKDDESVTHCNAKYSHHEKEDGGTNITVKKNVAEVNNQSLQNGLTTSKQEKHNQYEEKQLLQAIQTQMKTEVQDDPNNDLNYDSSDNENDINYDSECNEEEEQGNDTTEQHKRSGGLIETYANPNYGSSDNEDPRNNSYLD